MSSENLKAIIVDDEPKVSKVLENELLTNFPHIEISAVVHNVSEAVDCIRIYKPDIVFLDIIMPGENGFDLLKYFDTIDFELIFVTSHSEYALNAIKVSALAYLLKPVETEELRAALELVKERKEIKHAMESYRYLLENIKKNDLNEQYIAINYVNEITFVKISDIIFCEGWERYTKIHLTDKREMVSSYNIGKYKALLEPYSFVQTHRSYVINPRHVLRIDTGDQLAMTGDFVIPIAHRKRHEIVEIIVQMKK
ncbi:MAG: LytTR family DNA-binding domain-containing protein [Saprospiraceae bacterium]